MLGRGVDVPSGCRTRPSKEANARGVREVESAGGGRPVTLAKSVRIHRRRAKIPRIDPRVLRRLPNCSATETIAFCSSVLFTLKHGGRKRR